MKRPARYPSPGELVGYAGIALAPVALAGCSSAAAPATGATPTTAASADGASGKAGDPAANNKAFHDSAVAHGTITARKACDLLTQSDAETAVGRPLPKNDANTTLETCQYVADDLSAGASVTVSSWESIKNAATGGTRQPETIFRSQSGHKLLPSCNRTSSRLRSRCRRWTMPAPLKHLCLQI
jgi:hypothetical protein